MGDEGVAEFCRFYIDRRKHELQLLEPIQEKERSWKMTLRPDWRHWLILWRIFLADVELIWKELLSN
jgi:hypothetical protein